jgi:hypothetical protein
MYFLTVSGAISVLKNTLGKHFKDARPSLATRLPEESIFAKCPLRGE